MATGKWRLVTDFIAHDGEDAGRLRTSCRMGPPSDRRGGDPGEIHIATYRNSQRRSEHVREDVRNVFERQIPNARMQRGPTRVQREGAVLEKPARRRMATSPTSCGISCVARQCAVLMRAESRSACRRDDRAIDEVLKRVAGQSRATPRCVCAITLVRSDSDARARDFEEKKNQHAGEGVPSAGEQADVRALASRASARP